MDEREKKLNILLNKEKWHDAKILLSKWLRDEPNDHWILTRLSLTYYEEKKYKKALEYAQKAYDISPKCPLVLWDLAGALYMLNKEDEAIKFWKQIINKGVEKVAFDECGEGKTWAKSLINDSFYRIGLAYQQIGKNDLAKKYIKSHIDNRKSTNSIYNLRMVKKKLEEIMKIE